MFSSRVWAALAALGVTLTVLDAVGQAASHKQSSVVWATATVIASQGAIGSMLMYVLPRPIKWLGMVAFCLLALAAIGTIVGASM